MRDSDNPRGPISRSVLAALDKELRREVIDFTAIRLGAERAEQLERGVIAEERLGDRDPLHVEDLAELRMCRRLADAYAAAEEEYLPSGPPMSPLTMSYFFCWAVFDSHVGPEKETFGTVAIDLCRWLQTEPSLVRLFECMQESRMGLYRHEGAVGDHVLLREFVTGTQHRCVVPAGYRGRPGEIWFARVLREPFETARLGYSVVFTTPYVLCREREGRFVFADPQEWEAFFARTISGMGITAADQAYSQLMKYGLSANYWNEYVFEAYVNHQQDMILLAGLPDVPLSRPHSRAREALRRPST